MGKSKKKKEPDFSEMQIEDIFDYLSEEENLSCMNFEEKVKDKFSKRSDLHAFVLLDKLLPRTVGIIRGADHDVIYLEADLEKLKEVATIDQLRELVCCGVFCDSDTGGLSMFV